MSCYSTDKHAVIHTLYGDRVSFEIIDVACGFIVNPQSNTKCGEVSTVHWVIVKHPGRVIVDLNLCSCHAISIVDDFLNKSRKEIDAAQLFGFGSDIIENYNSFMSQVNHVKKNLKDRIGG